MSAISNRIAEVSRTLPPERQLLLLAFAQDLALSLREPASLPAINW